MAVLAELEEIEQFHRTLADLQGLIHVERVYDHCRVLQPSMYRDAGARGRHD
jgi:hypothetical protein